MSYSPEPISGCWIWERSYTKDGYPVIAEKGKQKRASRVSYKLHNGDFDSDLFVCHVCDNPSCVNPSHLFLGSARDNTQDCLKKGRANRPKGEDHPMSRLSNENIDLIRILRRKNLPLKLIASMFDISFQHVSSICKGKVWKI